MSTALIVIDVQNDFCPGGALAVEDGDTVVEPCNALLRSGEFPVTVLTQDWHPHGHSSFASTHESREPFSTVEMPYGPQVLWPDHCMIGSRGASIHKDLASNRADVIVRKGFRPEVDSYSAFFENDHETPTGLHGYLQTRGVKRVVLAGLATDFCVGFSALDAASLGYEVRVEMDACRAIDLDGSLDVMLDRLREAGVELTGGRAAVEA